MTTHQNSDGSDEKELLHEQLSAQQDMLMRTTRYMQEIQDELSVAKDELASYNKNLENKVRIRTQSLAIANHKLSKELKNRQKYENQLVSLNKELASLLYRASHDLKSPITTSKGIINLLQTKDQDNESASYLDMLNQSLDQLSSLIKNIEFIHSIKKEPIKKEEFKLKELIWDQIKEFEEQGVVNNDKCKLVFNYSTDIFINSDQSLFTSIIREILKNSVQYNSNNKHEDHLIKIDIKNENDYIIFTCSDNGDGIDENVQHFIFEMFYRAHEKSHGSGLGLYLVKLAAERLNGKIEFYSKKGIGTKIKFFLPLK